MAVTAWAAANSNQIGAIAQTKSRALARLLICSHLLIRNILIQALTCCEAPYASRSGGEEASAKHQNAVRQSLGAQIFPHQATSGIMRELSLMCARRVCPLPIGLCGGKRGETREEGVTQDLICSHSFIRNVLVQALTFTGDS